MYEPETTPKLLAIRLSGKLGRTNYECRYPWLRERLAEPSRPSNLVVMDDFECWDSAGALLDVAHHDDVRRLAMVGDCAWQKWMTLITAPSRRISDISSSASSMRRALGRRTSRKPEAYRWK